MISFENLKLAIINSGSRIIVAGSVFLISVITARYLDRQLRGEFAIYINYLNLLTAFLGFGVADTLFRKNLLVLPADEVWKRAYWLLPLSFILSLLTVFIILNHNFVKMPIAVPLISAGVSLQIFDYIIRNLAIRLNKLNLYNLMTVINRTLSIVLVIIVTLIYHDPLLIYVAYISCFLLPTLTIIISSKLSLPRIRDVGNFFVLLKNSLPLHAGAIGAILLSQGDQFIVGKYLGKSSIGLYQISLQTLGLFILIPSTLNTIIFQRISNENQRLETKNIKYALGILIIISVFIITLVHLLAETIISTIFGVKYGEATTYIKMLSWSSFGLLSGFLMAPFWIYSGKAYINSIFMIILAVLALTLDLYLVNSMGIGGIVKINVSAYTLIFIFNVTYWIPKIYKGDHL